MSTTTEANIQPPFTTRLRRSLVTRFQVLLDSSAPHTKARWIGLVVALAIYSMRVYRLAGFYIVSYALGIFLLNLLIGFLTPQEDPDANDGGILPSSSSDEFKPFSRRLPEFKFWYTSLKAIVVAFVCTFFSVFDVPVFWPILLIYFIILFVLTMKRQINHMIQHKYVPFSRGKPSYSGKKSTSSSAGSSSTTTTTSVLRPTPASMSSSSTTTNPVSGVPTSNVRPVLMPAVSTVGATFHNPVVMMKPSSSAPVS